MAPDSEDSEDELEVACRKWLRMKGNEFECLWPKEDLTEAQLISLITKQEEPHSDWIPHKCEVVSCYGTYLDAHLGRKGRIRDPAYETEKEFGVGRRKRGGRHRLISDEEDDENEDKGKKPNQKPKLPSAPIMSISPSNKQNIGFSVKKSIKSPVKVVASKSKAREVNNNFTLKLARKDKGTKVESLAQLKKLVQRKGNPVATSPNWKATPLKKSKKKQNLSPGGGSSSDESTKAGSDEDHDSDLLVQDGDEDRQTSKDEKKIVDVDEEEKENEAKVNQEHEEKSEDVSPVSDLKSRNGKSSKENRSNSSGVRPFSPLRRGHSFERGQSPRSVKSPPSFNSPRGKITRVLFSSPAKKDTYTEFERLVLAGLKEVNQKCEVICANQNKLNLNLIPNEKVLSKPSGMPTVPVKNEKDLQELLKALKKPDNVSYMATYLSTFVSKEPDQLHKSAVRVMVELIGNCVARNFNFKGNKGKQSFEDSALWTVVKGAIVLKLESPDLSQAEAAIKVWLKDAPWRTQEDGEESKQKQKKRKRKDDSPDSPPPKSPKKSPAKAKDGREKVKDVREKVKKK